MTPILIAAGNPSEWTGPTGNNTWLLPGREPALVDAGVGHAEHVEGLPALRDRWRGLLVVDAAGEPVPAGDGLLEIIPTPGHSPDHLCFFDREAGDLYCGDLARKGGTIVIPAKKGGDLRAYLASLRLVRELAPRRLLPGHGPIVDDPAALIDEYIAHRQMREQQILQAMLDGARTVDEIVRRVYPALPESLSSAAADSVRAHLAKLRDDAK
jgi:glyoxylase-like metal-dependent hydrolase (beta-lactamase superfamily II)